MELRCVCFVGAILITNWKNVEFDNTPASEKVVAAWQIQKTIICCCVDTEALSVTQNNETQIKYDVFWLVMDVTNHVRRRMLRVWLVVDVTIDKRK